MPHVGMSPLQQYYIGFSSPFHDVILGSLKSFYQSNHQVDICLYLTTATPIHHFIKLH